MVSPLVVPFTGLVTATSPIERKHHANQFGNKSIHCRPGTGLRGRGTGRACVEYLTKKTEYFQYRLTNLPILLYSIHSLKSKEENHG